MTDPAAVEVGVALDRRPDRIGEWLADAAAFDAAGADALWVDFGVEPELDVLAMAAALAVMTFRARLIVALPGAGSPESARTAGAHTAGLGRTLATISRLGNGRLALVADAGDDGRDLEIFRRVPGEPGVFEGAGGCRWVSVPPPQGRASWRAACSAVAGRGARGVLVPADPRLLDILRNPDDPGDRRDLQLAQG